MRHARSSLLDDPIVGKGVVTVRAPGWPGPAADRGPSHRCSCHKDRCSCRSTACLGGLAAPRRSHADNEETIVTGEADEMIVVEGQRPADDDAAFLVDAWLFERPRIGARYLDVVTPGGGGLPGGQFEENCDELRKPCTAICHQIYSRLGALNRPADFFPECFGARWDPGSRKWYGMTKLCAAIRDGMKKEVVEELRPDLDKCALALQGASCLAVPDGVDASAVICPGNDREPVDGW